MCVEVGTVWRESGLSQVARGPGAGWAKGHGAQVLGWVRCLEGRGGLQLPPSWTLE